MQNLLKHPTILFIVLFLGIAAAVLLVKTKPAIEHEDKAMQPRHAEVITVRKQLFAARVVAYGNVKPAVMLQGKAEVSGKVSYVHAELKAGGSIPAATVVVRIDPEDYEVSLEQTRADLSANESSLVQLQTEEASTRRSLQLAQENLRVGEKDLKRMRGLWNKKIAARSAVDAEEQKVIQLRQQLEDLQGRLNAYTSRKAGTAAQISRAQQQVKGQTTALGRTEISIPFDARISSVEVEVGEFVPVGGALFEASNTAGVEIKAELPINSMRTLFSNMRGQTADIDATNAGSMLASLNLKVNIRLIGLDSKKAVWEGRVMRFSDAVDPIRRTLGIVIAVDNSYEKIILGERPPLLKGMYVAAEISAPERQAIVIPRQALHQGRVYLVNAAQQLEIRPIEILLQQNDQVVVDNGLLEGDQLIVNDLMPVIPGMPLMARAKMPLVDKLGALAASGDSSAATAKQ